MQVKLQTEVKELRESNGSGSEEIRMQQIELIRLREEMSSKVIDEEVLRNKLTDNQIILEQTMSNYDTKIKNLTTSIEKQVEINETYYAYMINAKKDFLDVQIEKSHYKESQRNYEMKYSIALEEKNNLETKFNHLQEE